MALQATEKLTQVLCRIPPKMMVQGRKTYSTFVESSRLLGLLPKWTDRNNGAPGGDKDEGFLKKAVEAAKKVPKDTNRETQTKKEYEINEKKTREELSKMETAPTEVDQGQPGRIKRPANAGAVRSEPIPEEPSTKKSKEHEKGILSHAKEEPEQERKDETEEESSVDEETADDSSEDEGEEGEEGEKEEEESPPALPKREVDESRVTLKQELKRPPRRFTGMEFHKLKGLSGIKFFAEAHVIDPDDKSHVFNFNVNAPWHCASLNLGEGADGSPLISYSDIHCFYRLPDGTQWVQHGHFWDTDDIKEHAKKHGLKYDHLLSSDHGEKELLKKDGIHYSRITDIEYECWVFDGREKIPEPEHLEGDSYYWRHTFDVDQWKLTS
mmetsp:Transcript_1020/g.6431  ORF Transcript_1020/g.6431 Transcript_1020/m.6431 type:complete len:383 (-) Transcript_1020:889-2037(-)